MRHNDDPGTERLRGDLRDYYGTAMFNGNPMAMMELEEVERASRSELDDIARRNGFDPSSYSTIYDSPYGSTYDSPGYSSGSNSSGIGISVSVHSESISSSTRNFFEPNGTNSDTGFFANYARRLKDEL